jgi:hypothetical protein
MLHSVAGSLTLRRVPAFRRTTLICGVLLALYTVLALAAVSRKSPIYDEPIHTLAEYVHATMHDFRFDYENPPLYKYWALLPNLGQSLYIDKSHPQWRILPADISQEWSFGSFTMYLDPKNDPDEWIGRGRVMMVLLAVALGVVIARWSWEVGGSVAAVAATFLFAFDPGFLGHGPLVKNDVILATETTALCYVIWRMGRRVTWINGLALGLLCGAVCTSKFSGVALPFLAALQLGIRALLPQSWSVLGRELQRRASRSLGALLILIVAGVMTVVIIWACYGFRFAATPDPKIHLAINRTIATIAHDQTDGSPAALAAWTPPLRARFVVWALDHHLLPEAWLNGLLFIYAGTLRRSSFLMGSYSETGWWYYYPLVMLFKTPIATLVAIAISAVVLLLPKAGRRLAPSPGTPGEGGGEGDFRAPAALDVQNHPHPYPLPEYRERGPELWTLACFGLPPILYAVMAVTTAAAGLRHVLPIYPFLYIAVGLAAARLWSKRAGRAIVAIVGMGLAIETLVAFPDYVAFFNIATGGERGGIRLLSDSNLDWGQDLPRLAAWQAAHSDRKLYLSYFGTVDPAHYGIRYTNLPGGYALGPPAAEPREPGVIAISATNLQGVFSEDLRAYYKQLWDVEPLAVLGGTIYLYEWPLKRK